MNNTSVKEGIPAAPAFAPANFVKPELMYSIGMLATRTYGPPTGPTSNSMSCDSSSAFSSVNDVSAVCERSGLKSLILILFALLPFPDITADFISHPAGLLEKTARAPMTLAGALEFCSSGTSVSSATLSPSLEGMALSVLSRNTISCVRPLSAGVTSSYARQSGRLAEEPTRYAAFGHGSLAARADPANARTHMSPSTSPTVVTRCTYVVR